MSQAREPMRMKAAFMRALSPRMRMSAARAIAKPPPQAVPWTRATIGCPGVGEAGCVRERAGGWERRRAAGWKQGESATA